MHTTTFSNSRKRALGVLLVAGGLVLQAPQASAQSLKTVGSNQDLFDILHNPLTPQGPRTTFPGLDPLPPLDVFPLTVNTLTAQPLMLDPAPYTISFSIPATGTFPFLAGGVPNRPFELPLNETDFIVDRTAAVRLGKALFWDMQVGSDGVQACGTCHFAAGADNRVKNQLNPGVNAGDNTLQVRGKNQAVTTSDFPFHKLINPNTQGEPLLNPANVVRDANDVMSSMGVLFRQFVDIPAPGAGAFVAGTNPPALKPDIGNAVPDPVGAAFQGVRRVEPRNTPTFFAAANNYDNFWDGRARHDFNGGSPFGAADPNSHIFVDGMGGLTATRQLIALSSMASLATGPALSNFEMSFDKRYWAKIGKKLLQSGVTPLANQLVDPNDSVLGPLSNQNITPGKPGLSVSYAQLIEQAFGPQFWSNVTQHLEPTPDPTDGFDGFHLNLVAGAAVASNTGQFTQKEANFSLFFGLSVQAYTQILLPNDSPFDQFHDANPNEFLGLVTDINPAPGVQVAGMTTRQLFGYDLFQGSNLSRLNPLFRTGNCSICHFSQELTENSIRAVHDTMPADLITGADMVLSGFMLENRLRGPALIAMEMDGLNEGLDGNGAPTGSALVDKGVYNIGVRPIPEDIGRGGNDGFGFPLSISALALRKQGFPVGAFSFLSPPVVPLPATLAPFVNPFPIGLAFPNINQTVFLPDTISPTVDIVVLPSGTFPIPNRVARNGSFKVPQLKNIELTGPYFHNGGVLTLRQLVDFYSRGGDFPITNGSDRDPLINDLHVNFGALFTETDKVALVDFLLALTDARVKFERAPFDHPEVIVPVDGAAPDNTAGRAALLADARFQSVPAVGAAGRVTPLPNFLGVSSVEGFAGVDHFDTASGARFLMSFTSTTTLPGLVASAANEDIVSFDSSSSLYSVYFDGSDVGLGSAALDGFCLLPGGDILMSFVASTTIATLTGGPGGSHTVQPSDIVRFTPTTLGATTAGTFSFYFDGSDVGLSTIDENIDAIALDAGGNLVISILGSGSVTGVGTVNDEDLIRFSATSLGATTVGSFSVYFDGSDVGLGTTTTEDIDAAFIGPNGQIYLSTQGTFSVTGVTGNGRDVLRFTPTTLGTTTAGTYDAFQRGTTLLIPGTANLSGFALQ